MRTTALFLILLLACASCTQNHLGRYSSRICQIHNIEMHEGTALLRYGLPNIDPLYSKAKIVGFPNSGDLIAGGCRLPLIPYKKSIVYFCDKCIKAETEWMKSNCIKNDIFYGRHELYYYRNNSPPDESVYSELKYDSLEQAMLIKLKAYEEKCLIGFGAVRDSLQVKIIKSRTYSIVDSLQLSCKVVSDYPETDGCRYKVEVYGDDSTKLEVEKKQNRDGSVYHMHLHYKALTILMDIKFNLIEIVE